MRNLIQSVSILILLSLINQNCANQKSPTGGPKDTIPPNLISSNPVHKQLNFQGDEIILVFDENVLSDQLRNNLIVAPALEKMPEAMVKKRTVTIDILNELEDSTTYTFNFFDGITDITEKSPAENLIIAFSTGPYIDSMRVSGIVKSLYDQTPESDVLVGLYPVNDSLNFQENSPTYLTTTKEDGLFSIENIKQDVYRLFAFNDENRNKRFESATEAHAVWSDTINLIEDYDSVNLITTKIDVTPLQLNSARAFGRYFEAKYNKELTRYDLTSIDSTVLPATIINDKSNIRFYNTTNLAFETDSLGIIITAYDTLQMTSIDTVYVIFKESKKKTDKLSFNVNSMSTEVRNQYNASFIFSKPIESFTADSIVLAIDSIQFQPDSIASAWNNNRTTLNLSIPINWDQLPVDTTIHPDSVPDGPKQMNLVIPHATFISVENDSTQAKAITLKEANVEDYGTLIISLQTEQPAYEFQLLSNDEVIRSIKNQSEFTLTYLDPGKYSIRVLIDNNQDGYWSPGNYLLDQQPEDIYLHNASTELKANWEVLIDNISF